MRGIAVGRCVAQYHVVCEYFGLAHWGWMLIFLVLGAVLLGTLGLLAGIWAGKIRSIGDVSELHHHAQQPGLVRRVLLDSQFAALLAKSHAFEPVFYMIDGFRYGFFGCRT